MRRINKKGKTIRIAVIAAALIPVVIWAVDHFTHEHKHMISDSCVENLRQLNGAVQQYMMANATTNTPSSIAQLDIYY